MITRLGDWPRTTVRCCILWAHLGCLEIRYAVSFIIIVIRRYIVSKRIPALQIFLLSPLSLPLPDVYIIYSYISFEKIVHLLHGPFTCLWVVGVTALSSLNSYITIYTKMYLSVGLTRLCNNGHSIYPPLITFLTRSQEERIILARPTTALHLIERYLARWKYSRSVGPILVFKQVCPPRLPYSSAAMQHGKTTCRTWCHSYLLTVAVGACMILARRSPEAVGQESVPFWILCRPATSDFCVWPRALQFMGWVSVATTLLIYDPSYSPSLVSSWIRF